MSRFSKLLAMPALAAMVGAGAMAASAPASAQMVRHPTFGHFRASHPVFRNRVVVRRPFVRDRFAIGIGFPAYYGGYYGSYGYPYYGYPYNDSYYDGYYGSSCDPDSAYYDPDDCGY